MDYLGIIMPITIGALIGYCTNYIAIKMLFRPRKEVKVFGKRLPFTPGVIPKNKPRVARACGRAVGESLLTGDDIKNVLLGDDIKHQISEIAAVFICDENVTFENVIKSVDITGGEGFEVRASVMVTEKIKEAAAEINYTDVIGKIASKVITEKFSGTMISMFLNESTISSITGPIGESIQDYVNEHGEEFIYPVVKKNIEEIKDIKPTELFEKLNIDKNKVQEIIEDVYIAAMEKYSDDIIKHINVAALVERKINEMSDEMLEDLVMSVMKNELQAVINLGALIGAVIGILNVFVI